MTGGMAVELDGIARRFGRRWPLRGVSLCVAPGEVVAVAGRNGSGKTTLLRVAATALRPTRGGGRIFGHDLVREADAVRRRTGMLGHRPGLYQDLTATENLRFAQKMWGGKASGREITAALEWAGLGPEAGTRVGSFSAGMQRRLALARLRLRPPDLLLLDEPYTSFDADGVARVNAFVRDLAGRGGAALVATHDLDRAEANVDRIVRLEAGRIRERDRQLADSGAGTDARVEA